MYVLINRELLTVLYKNRHFSALDNIRHIECPETGTLLTCVAEGKDTIFGTLTDLELRLLHRNLCGQSFDGYSRPHLIATVAAMCMALPEDDINVYEAELQAMKIPFGDKEYYKFQPGSVEPLPVADLFYPLVKKTAKLSIPFIPVEPPPLPTPQYKALLAQYDEHKAAKDAKEPRAARESNPSTYVPPAGGSKTGRVWEIAEPIYQAAPDKTNWKEIRKAVVSACEAEGINSSTASVQYGKWRRTKE